MDIFSIVINKIDDVTNLPPLSRTSNLRMPPKRPVRFDPAMGLPLPLGRMRSTAGALLAQPAKRPATLAGRHAGSPGEALA